MNKSLMLLVVVFVPALLESRRARRNERAMRARGAIEPPRDVYPLMLVIYPTCFLAMIAEGWSRPAEPGRWVAAGAALYIGAKALKYWAVSALGDRWTFRVLVLPGAPLITSGPYRWLRHPNYVGVAGELASVALMANAPIAGVVSVLTFGTLMLARIRVEERALRVDACER
jgi:methyltransferase